MSRGKIHKYLCMTLDCIICGQVKTTMNSYIEEIICAFGKAKPKGGKKNSSAAPNNLFVVNEDCKKINHNKVVEFHKLAGKTLYSTKWARMDTCRVVNI